MSDGPPILAYASSHYIGATTPDRIELSFERPSVFWDLVLRFIAATVAIFSIAGTGWAILAKFNREGIQPGMYLIYATCLAIMAQVGWWSVKGVSRTIRFGKCPITLELRDGRIVIDDPVRFGDEPKVLSLDQLERCRAVCDGLAMSPMRYYHIYFHSHSLIELPVTIQVRVGEKGIVERAVADLQRAIELHAAKR